MSNTPENVQLSEANRPGITRKQVLGMLGGVVAAATLAACTTTDQKEQTIEQLKLENQRLQRRLDESTETTNTEIRRLQDKVNELLNIRPSTELTTIEESNLEKAGVSSWIDVLQASRTLRRKFGQDGTQFNVIALELETIASGRAPSELVNQLKSENWGTKIGENNNFEEIIKEATEAAEKLNPEPLDQQVAPEKKDTLKTMFRDFAKVAPAYILALYKNNAQILVDNFRGYMWSGGLCSSISGEPQRDWVPFIHENQHYMDMYFLSVKEYLPLSKVTSYIEANYRAVSQTLTTWANTDLENAQKFKYGSPLLSMGDETADDFSHKIDTSDLIIPDLLKELLQNHQATNALEISKVIKTFTSLNIPKNLEVLQRYLFSGTKLEAINAYIHLILQNFIEVRRLRDQGLPIPPEFEQMVNNKVVQELVRYATSEVSHFYVGPQQKKNGVGLPASLAEVQDKSMILTTHNMNLETARLAAFTPLDANSEAGAWHRALIGDTIDTKPEAKEQSETSQLERFGFKRLHTQEFEGVQFKLYQTPDMPAVPNRKGLYIELPQDPQFKDIRGLLFTVVHDQYNAHLPHELQIEKIEENAEKKRIKLTFKLGNGDPVETEIIISERKKPQVQLLDTPTNKNIGFATITPAPDMVSGYYYYKKNVGYTAVPVTLNETECTDLKEEYPITAASLFTLNAAPGVRYQTVPRYFSSTVPIEEILLMRTATDDYLAFLTSSGREGMFFPTK